MKIMYLSITWLTKDLVGQWFVWLKISAFPKPQTGKILDTETQGKTASRKTSDTFEENHKLLKDK